MRFQQLLPCLFIVGVLGRRGPSKPVHQALREHDLVHQSHYPYAWGMDEMHHGRADEEEEVKQGKLLVIGFRNVVVPSSHQNHAPLSLQSAATSE